MELMGIKWSGRKIPSLDANPYLSQPFTLIRPRRIDLHPLNIQVYQ